MSTYVVRTAKLIVLSLVMAGCTDGQPIATLINSLIGQSFGLTISNPAPQYVNSAGTVTFNVIYTLASSVTLTSGDITVNASGVTCGAPVVSGSGNVLRTVTVSGCTGNGTVGISIAANTAMDAISNMAPAVGPSSLATVDNTAPTLGISGPSVGTINVAGSTDYTVTYTGADNVNLIPANVTLVYTGGVTCSHSVSGAGTVTRTITVNSCTGNGTVEISSIAAGTATDFASNSAAAAGPSATATVSNTGPTLVISAPSLSNVNNLATVTYTLTYGGATSVTVGVPDITLNTVGATCSIFSVTPGNPTSTVTLNNCTGDGTVGISVAANTAVDALLNPANAAGPSTTFIVDNTAPTLNISAGPSISLANGGSAITYTLTYGGTSTTSPTPASITLNTTGGASCVVSSVSGANPTYTVTLNSCTGNGTVGINVIAGTGADAAGNTAPFAGPSGVFTVDTDLPILTCANVAGNGWGWNNTNSFDYSAGYSCVDGGSGCNGGTLQCNYNPGSGWQGWTGCSGIWSDSTTGAGGQFQVRQTDNAGNTGVSTSCTVKIDTASPTPPGGVIVPAINIYQTSTFTSWTVNAGSDAISGIDGSNSYWGRLFSDPGCTASVTGIIPTSTTSLGIGAPGDGTYYLGVYSLDKAGNQSSVLCGLNSITVDNVAPTFMGFQNPTVDTTIGGTNFIFGWNTFSDTNSMDPNPYLIEKWSGPNCTGGMVTAPWQAANNYDWTGLTPATYTVRIRAMDAAGNQTLSPCSSNVNITGGGSPFNNAVQFNGTTTFLDYNTNGFVSVAPPFTVEAFIKTFGSGSTQMIYQSWGGLGLVELGLDSANRPFFKVVQSGCSTPTYLNSFTSLISGTPYHIAAVWRATNVMDIYINGNLDISVMGPATYCSGTNQHTIGSSRGGGNYFNGQIDELRYSNVERYFGGFTPTSVPYSVDGSTTMLFHLDNTTNMDGGFSGPTTFWNPNGIFTAPTFLP